MAKKEQGTDEVVYAEVPDGRGNLIRVYSQTWKGSTRVHIRQFWYPPDSLEPKPTRIGFALDEARFRELMGGMMSAEEKLRW